MFRRKLVGAFASTLMAVGLLSPVANAQSERIVLPEERDAYVAEFQYDPNNPPEVDGVGGLTDEETAELQDKIRQAEASGPPQDEIIPGQMWSDKVGVPEGYDKAEADRSEVAIAKEQSQLQARGFQTTAERCQSFWLIPFKVCGEILDQYERLGGATSWLLLPIEHQSINPDGQGHRQRFVGGAIYQHPDAGTHAVSLMTMGLWQRHGWEAGWLGYPLGGEVPVQGSNTIDGEINGWVQRFQGGRVYRTPLLQGFQLASINGVILDKWLELGGPDSELGFPIADEAKTADGVGRFSVFQQGSIYWHPNTGAHAVTGPYLAVWGAAGFEQSSYGYPTGSPATGDLDPYSQPFEHKELNLATAMHEAGTELFQGKEINSFLLETMRAYAAANGIDLETAFTRLPERSTSPQPMLAPGSAPIPYNPHTGGIEVPGTYRFDGDNSGDALHDLCTSSFDEFPSITATNANFRGPCAIHDMCYDTAEHITSGYLFGLNNDGESVYSDAASAYRGCDSEFHSNLITVCRNVYGFWNPNRDSCLLTAEGYWVAVIGAHHYHYLP